MKCKIEHYMNRKNYLITKCFVYSIKKTVSLTLSFTF